MFDFSKDLCSVCFWCMIEWCKSCMIKVGGLDVGGDVFIMV